MKHLALVLVLLAPLSAFAAISPGTPITMKNPSGGSVSGSYTVEGPKACLVVGVIGGTSNTCASTITWGSTALPQLTATHNDSGRWVHIYAAKVKPGTHTLSINCGDADFSYATVEEYDGVKECSNVTSDTVDTSISPFSLNLTTTANNSWMVMYLRGGAELATAGENTTLRYASSSDANIALFDSNGPVGPIGINAVLSALAPDPIVWTGSMLELVPANQNH